LKQYHLTSYLLILCLNAIIIDTWAAPALIKDSRLRNLNGYPSIGRGYNMFSNTLQSTCFSSIEKNTPTFNLNYVMHKITNHKDSQSILLGQENIEKQSALYELLDRYGGDLKKKPGDSTKKTKHVREMKHILLIVELDTYYHHLNETESSISDSAMRLLKDQQYVTFFNSCGYYYIRGMGSYSAYMALIQYQEQDDDGDGNFETRLTTELSSFHGEDQVNEKFQKEAYDRYLQIYISAIGLQKGGSVNLIPLNIQSFKNTIRDAAKTMQQSNSGIINSMEVIPWVEHPGFNLAMVHSLGVNEDEKLSTPGSQENTYHHISDQFLKQRRLELNAGVITEINRISNEQIEDFQFANVCKRLLKENYGLSLHEDSNEKYREIKFISEDGEHYIYLHEFQKYFDHFHAETILASNILYLHGDKKINLPGAADCIRELYAGGLSSVDFRDIPSCQQAISYHPVKNPIVEQFCLPNKTTMQGLRHIGIEGYMKTENDLQGPERVNIQKITDAFEKKILKKSLASEREIIKNTEEEIEENLNNDRKLKQELKQLEHTKGAKKQEILKHAEDEIEENYKNDLKIKQQLKQLEQINQQLQEKINTKKKQSSTKQPPKALSGWYVQIIIYSADREKDAQSFKARLIKDGFEAILKKETNSKGKSYYRLFTSITSDFVVAKEIRNQINQKYKKLGVHSMLMESL
jgi:hypothetical protein